MTYEARWYWCDLVDYQIPDALDWDKVPAHKRDLVRARWQAIHANRQKPQRWKLWGPQIRTYEQLADMTVVVVGPA